MPLFQEQDTSKPNMETFQLNIFMEQAVANVCYSENIVDKFESFKIS